MVVQKSNFPLVIRIPHLDSTEAFFFACWLSGIRDCKWLAVSLDFQFSEINVFSGGSFLPFGTNTHRPAVHEVTRIWSIHYASGLLGITVVIVGGATCMLKLWILVIGKLVLYNGAWAASWEHCPNPVRYCHLSSASYLVFISPFFCSIKSAALGWWEPRKTSKFHEQGPVTTLHFCAVSSLIRSNAERNSVMVDKCWGTINVGGDYKCSLKKNIVWKETNLCPE